MDNIEELMEIAFGAVLAALSFLLVWAGNLIIARRTAAQIRELQAKQDKAMYQERSVNARQISEMLADYLRTRKQP